jgi:hypothetical protein
MRFLLPPRTAAPSRRDAPRDASGRAVVASHVLNAIARLLLSVINRVKANLKNT